jgi:Ser/Thr protein kinase RdoA (MazF antagonist)
MELYYKSEWDLVDEGKRTLPKVDQLPLLHFNLRISAELLKSSQGSVFFVRNNDQKEFVLKIYKKAQFHTFECERKLMEKIKEHGFD